MRSERERMDGQVTKRQAIDGKSKKNLFLKAECLKQLAPDHWLLNTDISSIFREHSPTLPNKRYVYKANNKVVGNKPVGIGHEFSCIGLSQRSTYYGVSGAAWNLPLSMKLVPFEENKNEFTACQVNELLNNEDLPFGKHLTINALDSNYASPEYIAETYSQNNLVNIIRISNNRNVWKKLEKKEQSERRKNNKDSRGANAIYGKKYKLNENDEWDLASDETSEFGIKNTKGKRHIVRVSIWKDMMFRSKRKRNMKDKPMHLARIELLDPETKQPVFKKPMWLGVWGKRRDELSGEQIFWDFRNRFDIEHFFRFGKQKLLLDKYQTPDEEHLQNWLEVVSLAYWLLWQGKDESKQEGLKWRKYDKTTKKREIYGLGLSPSQVQREMQRIILGFEQKPYLPNLQIKGEGRKLGQVLPKRKHYPVRFKRKKMKKLTG